MNDLEFAIYSLAIEWCSNYELDFYIVA